MSMPFSDQYAPFPTIKQLQKEAHAQWPRYDEAVRQTQTTETTLKEVLLERSPKGRLLDSDSSLVLCGSFARWEMVSDSDCDWTLLINGVVSNSHTKTARTIEEIIKNAERNKRGLHSPGSSGIFGNISFSHNLVHQIGGGPDTNDNLTRRILMLLESRPLSLSEADRSDQVWREVVRNILARYFQEEVHFSPDGSRRVPRFLLNDITRYWRTICVDYAAKHWNQDGQKWALRNAKLRFSRKLLAASGLAFCFSCELSPPESVEHSLFGPQHDKTSAPFIDSAVEFARTPPLEVLAKFVDSFVHDTAKRREVSRLIFGSYDQWLQLLNDSEKRAALKDLDHRSAEKDETFQQIRTISKDFADGLKLLFFNRVSDTDDPIANLSLEYVGF